MPRVTKKPEERRQELLDIAEHLFRERGFENVQVSDIVSSVGVAQGTFYYYFPSKDDVMLAILERNWSKFTQMASERIGAHGTDPLRRLLGLMRSFFAPADPESMVESYFGGSANPEVFWRFHAAFDEMRLRLFEPVITGIVEDGVAAGVFAPLVHIAGVVEVIFMGISSYMHVHAPQFCDPSTVAEGAGVVGELLEKVLGLAKGSFDILSAEGEGR